MFITIVFDSVLSFSSPVSSQDFYSSLPMDQSPDVSPDLGVFVILQCRNFIWCMHLHSSYYYYDYVTIGMLRLLFKKRNSQLEVKEQKCGAVVAAVVAAAVAVVVVLAVVVVGGGGGHFFY